ncbi:hypothetical protein OHA77_24715 [Streptosporangium sp. NBC_01639]|uniref:hypothetical protein n=1 Tax=Streptosporangium sp. NBC_01639 TaxID=2975948 RepID=UPI0038669155|nr:hypothetical protein OHA77_24715 [Streptosporangium sp. NBC_01639]
MSGTNLSPELVRIYLRSHSWQRTEELPRTEVWRTTIDGEPAEVVVPRNPRLLDFDKLVRQLLETLEIFEERDANQILLDMNTAVVDRHYARLQPANLPSGALPLPEGIKAYASFRDLFLSAVYRATLVQTGEPHKPVEPSRKPDRIYDFLRAIRLVVPVAGSYVLTAEVPVAGADPEQMVLGVDGRVGGMPQPRRVSAAVQEGTAAAWQAAQAYLQQGSRDPAVFEEHAAATWGLTANLCESLVALSSEGRIPFSLRVAWATTLEHDLPTEPLEFDAPVIEALQAGAQFLRHRYGEQEVLFRGTVVKLERVAISGPGTAVLLIGPEAEPTRKRRRAYIDLDQERYAQAIEAHREGKEVLVQGNLEYRQGRWRLVQVQSFQVEETSD